MSEIKVFKPVLKPIDWLKPYALNSKKHDPAQVKKIVEAIKLAKGHFDQPIVTDVEGNIIKGHGRRLAAIELGYTHVPVIIRDDLTPDEVKAARVADNRVAQGDWDTDLLKLEIAEIDLDLSGVFDKKELEFFTVDVGALDLSVAVADVAVEAARMTSETGEHVHEADSRSVRIDKALGFKSISGADERIVARFMAIIESQTGLTGASAFISYIKKALDKA